MEAPSERSSRRNWRVATQILPIWISGGTPRSYAERVFARAGIDRSRLHLDYQAVDTVTNFTTLVDEFQARGINSVLLITSDYHMRRASIIGEIVLGSRGIEFKPVSVPSKRSPEPIEKAHSGMEPEHCFG